MKKLFKFLLILQERKVNITLTKKIDRSETHYYKTQKRLNPFNPLTYIVISVGFICAVIMFGVIGWKEEFEWHKELKWK